MPPDSVLGSQSMMGGGRDNNPTTWCDTAPGSTASIVSMHYDNHTAEVKPSVLWLPDSQRPGEVAGSYGVSARLGATHAGRSSADLGLDFPAVYMPHTPSAAQNGSMPHTNRDGMTSEGFQSATHFNNLAQSPTPRSAQGQHFHFQPQQDHSWGNRQLSGPSAAEMLVSGCLPFDGASSGAAGQGGDGGRQQHRSQQLPMQHYHQNGSQQQQQQQHHQLYSRISATQHYQDSYRRQRSGSGHMLSVASQPAMWHQNSVPARLEIADLAASCPGSASIGPMSPSALQALGTPDTPGGLRLMDTAAADSSRPPSYKHSRSPQKNKDHGAAAGSPQQQSPIELVFVTTRNTAAGGDAKQRLRWTPKLRSRFKDAVASLGGLSRVTATEVHEKMDIPGLTLAHVKSHLQLRRRHASAGAGGSDTTECDSSEPDEQRQLKRHASGTPNSVAPLSLPPPALPSAPSASEGGQLAAHASPQVASVQQQWAAEQMGVAKHVIAKQQQLHQCLQRNMLAQMELLKEIWETEEELLATFQRETVRNSPPAPRSQGPSAPSSSAGPPPLPL